MSDAGVRRRFRAPVWHLGLRATAAAAAALTFASAGAQPASAPAQGLSPAAGLPSLAASTPEARLQELAQALAQLRSAEAGRQAQTAQLLEQVKHLRGQVEWHEAVLPWLGAALALLAGGLGLTARALLRRPRARPAAAGGRPPEPRASVPPSVSASASRPGSLPPPAHAAHAAGAASAPPCVPTPAIEPPVAEVAGVQAVARPPALPLAERPEFVSSTRPVPQLFSIPDTPAPLLSADALIDLEQQADFFIALGQDDAAVERLVAELRTVDGHSPMPWLKLLQIHRRRGDRAAYQRALDRFRQRFGPHGADWEHADDPQRGLDDYPEAVARLQALWPTPQDVMALLERLVGGCEPTLVLSLTASQDALLLYQLARSYVPGAEPAPTPDVDLLLPMDPSGSASRPARSGAVDLDLSSGLAPL